MAALVQAAVAGDTGAWHELVARYSDLVWAIGRAHGLDDCDAADVSQTTWLRLTENLSRLSDPSRVGAWLATTARRESLRVLREHARLVPSSPEELLSILAAGFEVPGVSEEAAALVGEREAELVRLAFKKLAPPCQRLLRTLTAEPRPSYAEVSAALGIRVGSIGPTRARCLAHLRGVLLELARLEKAGARRRPAPYRKKEREVR